MRHFNSQGDQSREAFLEATGINLYFIDWILHTISPCSVGRLIDIGCGTGNLAKCLAAASGLEPFGTEISTSAYAIASTRINCSLVEAGKLPFKDRFFSLAVAKDVLPSITRKKEWLEEIVRVLDKRGVFITFVPSRRDLDDKPLLKFIEGGSDRSRHAYGEPSELFNMMRVAGFDKVRGERIYLGNVNMGKSYFERHSDGYFNDTLDSRFEEPRRRGLGAAMLGSQALNKFGIKAHYEWERTLVIGEKL